MRNKKFYYIIIGITVIFASILLISQNTASEEEKQVISFYPQAKKVELIKDVGDDTFISLNFPAIKRAYSVDGETLAFVASCTGYNGPVDVLAAFNSGSDTLMGIKIIHHEESMDYAEHIEKDWFLDRFKNILAQKYLNLVVLDKENPEDIVQVTGATVSSQAVVTAVNACIGAYQYINNEVKMAKVSDVVPQEMWQKDINSFAINFENKSIRINTDEIKEYNQVEMDVTLINTTGTETDMHIKGPSLNDVLKKENIDLSDYAGIGVTGRDGYYTLIDKEKLDVNEVILVWEVDGKSIKDAEKPIRIALPNELGPYWVKMVSNIDLYKEISPKDIDKVHVFNALTKDIEPYYYEYYGSKDKSIKVGQILKKFDEVDEKGLFSMSATDGLVKNETISLVRDRYYIKVEGDNAPMNISPTFKLGMNVKEMTHFSTTKDAVIFPEKIKEVVRTKNIDNMEAMLLEDVLLTAGMRWEDDDKFIAVDSTERKKELSLNEMLDCYISYNDGIVNLYKNNEKILADLLRIEKK